MTRAKVYDFDPNWDAPDGEDDHGPYIISEVVDQGIFGDAVLKNGTLSFYYRLLEDR